MASSNKYTSSRESNLGDACLELTGYLARHCELRVEAATQLVGNLNSTHAVHDMTHLWMNSFVCFPC